MCHEQLALKYINESGKYQERAKMMEDVATRRYFEGIRKGLDIAEKIFISANCEKAVVKD